MEAQEIDATLDELESRLDRLRSLYEQYFLGIEKIEPTVARKDVDRRFWLLRKTQIRNTARRFRLQVLVQRYNTFQQHWTRVCREIENGTYVRHLLKVKKNLGEEPKTWAARKRLGLLRKGAPDGEAPADEPAAAEDPSGLLGVLIGDDMDAEVLAATAAAFEHAERPRPARPAHERYTLDDLGPLNLDFDDDGRPTVPPPKAAPPAPPLAPDPTTRVAGPVKIPTFPPPVPVGEPAPGGAQRPPLPKPGQRQPLPPGRPVIPGAPKLPTGLAVPRAPAAAAPPAPPATRPAEPFPPAPSSPSSSPPPTPQRPMPAERPRVPGVAPANGARPPGIALPPRPPLPSRDPAAPAPRPGVPPGARPPLPAAGGPPQPRPVVQGAPKPAVPAAAAPKPAAPAGVPAPAPRPAVPAAAQKAGTPQIAAVRPPAAARDLSDDRLRRIHQELSEAKKQLNLQNTVSFDALSKSLRDTERKLREEHKGRSVDFQVVVKDGKAVVKPIVKK